MFSIIGAILFLGIAIMTILVACGLPLGEFTMGGKYKVLPPKMRFAAWLSLVIQLFAIIIILQTGGLIPLLFPLGLTKGICIFFTTYLSLNTLMNFSSKSKKEKYVMTPLSLVAAICFWITAFQV